MRHLLGIPGFLLLSLVAVAADEKITWEKADSVLAQAAATGKPVVWYFVVNQFAKDGLPPPVDAIDKADKAFANSVIIKRRDSFHWVRGDQTRATAFKVQGAPGIVITDADGDVLLRATIASPENLFDAMQTVLKEKYVDTPVAWGDVVRTGPIKKRLLVIGFDNENGDALKSLEDKTLVKYHKICEFVKLPYEKDGEAAKKWSVDKTPTIVLCDASENVLAKVSGKIAPCHLKAAIQKAIAKLDAPRQKR
jgi:thioredoxin-related protein